jgi:UPF0716 family protein affecting phage T7 exclusion
VWSRPDRGLILGILTLAYVVASAVLGFIAARRLGTWQPFAETRRQLGEDAACLRDALDQGPR